MSYSLNTRSFESLPDNSWFFISLTVSRKAKGAPFEVFDVLKPQERFQVHPVAKDPAGRCICQDKDYVDVYLEKYGSASWRTSATP